MSVESITASSMSFLTHLIEPALRSLLVAAVAGLALAGLRIYGVKSRLAVWRIVLCAALAMPLLSYVMPSMPVSARFFSALPAIRGRIERELSMTGAADSGVVDSVPTPVSGTTSSSAALAHFSTNRIDLQRVKVSEQTIVRTYGAARVKIDGVATAHPDVHRAARPAAESAPAPYFWTKRDVPGSLVVLYLALVACFVARMITGIFLGSHLNRKAHTIRDERAVERLKSCAVAAGLSEAPRLAESAALSVPVTFGVANPSILLPATWREWSEDEFSSVLFHEMSHIARHDALAERVSLVHRAIFWFSPLSWWLDRNLAQLAEEASDEAALASGIDRTRYAETLLNFFRALETAPGRVWWQGVSMAAAGQAEKRVDRILTWNGDSNMKLKKPVIAVAVCFAIPLVALASAITPRFDRTHLIQETAQAPAAPQVPKASPAPRPATSAVAAPAPSASVNAQAAAAAKVVSDVNVKVITPPQVYVDPKTEVYVIAKPGEMPTIAPAPRAIVIAPVIAASPKVYAVVPTAPPAPHVLVVAPLSPLQSNHVTVNNAGRDGDEFMIVTGGSSFVVINPGSYSGRVDGDDAAGELREKYGDNFIWFRHAGKAYVITDPQTIQHVKAAYDAIDLIGKKQAALGEEQAAIGEQQAAIGQLMSGVSMNVPDISAEMKAIDEQMKSIDSDATRKAMAEAQANLDAAIAKLDVNSPQMAEQLAKLQAEAESLHTEAMAERLSQMQEKLGELQEKLGEAQSGNGETAEKLSKLESELGAKEEALGKKEGELGKQEEAASKDAERQVRQILNDAIAKGVAKPE